MFLEKENYRDFEKSLFIYLDGAPAAETKKAEAEECDVNEASKDFEENFFKGIELPKDTTDPKAVVNFVETIFKQNFSPDKYEAGIRQWMIGKCTNDANTADRMARESRARYEKIYIAGMARFKKITENRISAYEDMKENIKSATRGNLGSLMADLAKTSRVPGATPSMEKVASPAQSGDKWPYKIPILGPIFKNVDLPLLGIFMHSEKERQYMEFQQRNTAKFIEFVKALSGKHLESEQYKDKLGLEQRLAYGHLTGKFKDGMEAYTKNQLNYIYENSHDEAALKQNLEGLRDNLVNYYKKYDVNGDGIMDLKELGILENPISQISDIKRLIDNSSDEDLEKMLEQFNFYNREVWAKTTEILTEALIRDATQNGCEAQLIAFVKKWTKTEGKMDFDTASDKLRGIMRKNAKAGVKETLSAAKKFNDEVNGAILEGMNESRISILKMDDINPPSIRVLAYDQRELILARRIIPKNIDDRLVAEFMSTGLVGREKLLSDAVRRQALFQAIQNIKKNYPKIYSDKYMKSVPKEVEKLVTMKLHPDREPKPHDKIGRLIAMIALAKEAEWVVKNLDKSQDFEGQKLATQFEDTKHEEAPPPIDLGFRSINRRYKTGYVSAAERGGFNGRDLTLGIVKVWAGLTLFLNFMNARKHMKDGKALGFIGAGKAMFTNPYFLAGAGAIYGIDKYQQNPEVKNYLFESAGGKERIATHDSLRSLSKKIPRKVVIAFINSPSEFSAMGEIMKHPKAGVKIVDQLVKKSRDRMQKDKSDAPLITKKDLKGVVSEEVWYRMSEGNPHMRFLFYEKMLSNPRNIRQLKANCENWM